VKITRCVPYTTSDIGRSHLFYLSKKEPFLDGNETGTTLVLSSSAGGEPHNYQRRGGKVNREEVGDSAEVEGTRHMHLCSMFPPANDSYRRSKLLSQRSAKRELRHTYFTSSFPAAFDTHLDASSAQDYMPYLCIPVVFSSSRDTESIDGAEFTVRCTRAKCQEPTNDRLGT
jgi:hypothetical protein